MIKKSQRAHHECVHIGQGLGGGGFSRISWWRRRGERSRIPPNACLCSRRVPRAMEPFGVFFLSNGETQTPEINGVHEGVLGNPREKNKKEEFLKREKRKSTSARGKIFHVEQRSSKKNNLTLNPALAVPLAGLHTTFLLSPPACLPSISRCFLSMAEPQPQQGAFKGLECRESN